MALIRINRLLVERFGISRRLADEWIRQKNVFVNSIPAFLGMKVDENHAIIEIDGKQVPTSIKKIAFALNKPLGVVCSLSPKLESGRPISEFFPRGLGLKPVGRLDTDSEGLIIVTNDGKLHYSITHPSKQIEKEYEVTLSKSVSNLELKLLTEGVLLTDGFCKPDDIQRISSFNIRITLHEGRNREIRRLLSAIQHKVVQLKRVRIGVVLLNDLPSGTLRTLTEEEVNSFHS